MAAANSVTVAPKWVIDLHGLTDALTTTSNSAKAAVIDAIRRGEMLIMKSVSEEMKEVYPHLWPLVTAIKPRRYIRTTVADHAAATTMQEMHGSSILGGLPLFAHFEAVAVAQSKGCTLVSGGKGLKSCKQIAQGCGIPSSVAGILDI
ncbi:hypothetical protein [Sphingomonas sp. 8AM]|uniref:hypothetical protein n=1 Tax=Sphingomonas sp. 8AM TaxID=2653170 RepID=UPI0012F36B10|nr:hypothetical protein [Sphingomonas sp. 8AM]VXD02861.1 conserved hypothetical protein [Sphingomonas sp. 8AM]